MYDNSKQITKEYLLTKVGEVAIFCKYLNLSSIREEELICNPLRNDKNPTASFKWVNDRIQFRDWSETFSRDCFNVAQLVTRKRTFYDTLIQIAIDFHLIGGKQYADKGFVPINVDDNLKEVRREVGEKKKISVITKDFHAVELNYWKQFSITKEDLKKFNIFSIAQAYVDDRLTYTWRKNDFGFAYYFGEENFKLYFPLREKGRFIHNNASVLQGWNQLPETGNHCLITKSYKDVIALSKFGIISLAPTSETMPITQELYEDLKRRFGKVFILYDNDWRGKRAVVKILKQFPDIIPLLFPKEEPKDFTDNIKIYGINDMAEMVSHYKELFNI